MELVGGAADAVGEHQDIALQPGEFLGGKLVTGAGGGHSGEQSVV